MNNSINYLILYSLSTLIYLYNKSLQQDLFNDIYHKDCSHEMFVYIIVFNYNLVLQTQPVYFSNSIFKSTKCCQYQVICSSSIYCFQVDTYKFIVMSQKTIKEEGQRGKMLGLYKMSLTDKTMSDRPTRKSDHTRVRGKSTPDSIPEVVTYLLMKEKFEQIYKRIEKITTKEDQPAKNSYKGEQTQMSDTGMRIVNFMNSNFSPEVTRFKAVTLNHKDNQPPASVFTPQAKISGRVPIQKQYTRVTLIKPIVQVQMMRKSRYRKKMLQPIRSKMSNNIKDYLSVEKISLREMEQSLLAQKTKLVQQYNMSNLLAFRQEEVEQIPPQKSERLKQPTPVRKEVLFVPRPCKFKAPFDLYYYRDFLWKVNFANQLIVEPIKEYDNRIKFYVGPGNNSNLIRGIIRRRNWMQLTDKLENAQIVWTQIKVSNIFQGQKASPPVPIMDKEERDRVKLAAAKRQKQGKTMSLLNELENERWQSYWTKHMQKQMKIKQVLRLRTKIMNLASVSAGDLKGQRVHNHFCNSFVIGNKKTLFQTMSEYYSQQAADVFTYLPLTFHIKNGLEDDEYLKFLQYYYSISKNNKSDEPSIHKFNAWIVKPGENSNRGNGIIVCLQLNEIKTILKRKEKHNDGTFKTYILQKYIERPLLYRKRKFDLRHYMMMNCVNGRMKGYWYREGYVRTTSTEYTLKISAGSVHLTNDAVQKYLPEYGKYQKGNKITYEQLQAYIKKQNPKFDFWKMIYPRMKKVGSDAISAAALSIDPQRRVNNFQIFGLDFMIDENYDVWLIEVNTNPCLETACPVLAKIIPRFIENTFEICIDPLFPAPLDSSPKFQDFYKNMEEANNFELIFDARIDGGCSISENILNGQPEQDADVYDDDGQDFSDNLL